MDKIKMNLKQGSSQLIEIILLGIGNLENRVIHFQVPVSGRKVAA
jgi:hypothetical protein